jgi:restriction endonuclease S subunit
MAFKQVRLGDYFKFEKGLGYKGEFLAEESSVGLVGIDSQVPGGGYKINSEKPYSGPYKPEHVVDVGDVIVAATDITQDGSVLGSTLMIPESTNYETLIYSGDVMRAIPLKPDEFSLEYFYNLYRVKKYRTKVAYGDTGTTVRRLSEDGICEQIVPLPDFPTQVAINEIISLIDQQIANNKDLSRNLETLAQSVFKSWFIDFDPVHAKKKGKEPFGMDPATASLFPSSFEDSEIGEIPRGWMVKPIHEEVIFCGGGTPSTKKSEYWDGEFLWTTPRDLSKQIGLITIDSERKLTQAGVEKISSKLLPTHSVLMSSRAPIGYISISAFPTAINQGFIGFPAQGKWSPLFIVNWLTFNMHEVKGRSGGGTFAEINRTAFRTIPFLTPPEKLMNEFREVTSSLLYKLIDNSVENAKLESIRVRLLDSLISGELEVPKELIAS